VLLLPLGASRGADEASGLFLVIRGQERPEFLDSDLEDAREFLGLVSPAMANIQTVSELRETAVRDDLAGCYNRRHFETFLAEEIARARRFRTRVSIVFFDMDNLKSVNTAHGHTMGSRSLQEVSERIDGRIRKIDKLFRFGGDEFCVILPETDTRGARHAAERARKAIAESPVLAAEVGGVGMTASLGIATFPDHAGSAEDLVQAADRAMQSVKRGGKNGIGVAVRAEPVAPGSGGAAGSAGAPRAPLEGKA
jgi:diguanylate cyclase (GGDEF)-like protein